MADRKWELLIEYEDQDYTINGDSELIDQHISMVLSYLKDQEKAPLDQPFKVNLKINHRAPENVDHIMKRNQLISPSFKSSDKEVHDFLHSLGTRIEWIYCLGISYILVQSEKENLITAKSIRSMYQHAQIKPPQNIHLCINQCVRKNYLEPMGKVEGAKAYSLTQDGVSFIKTQASLNNASSQMESYENEVQQKTAEEFISLLTEEELHLLQEEYVMEDRILKLLYLLDEKGISGPMRPNFIYMLIVKIYKFDGLPRSVYLGLSRTRPLTKKVKNANKVHYQLTKEGKLWAEEQYDSAGKPE
ncbi:hypothetical protein [Jeotgalibacillus malaysiensis]|uniref:hypothetical protein n=1 Tax=Jeotgalibacillus malaysiensis TaxID=1508404 RepID=UPI00385167EE